jgi:hypothetical protein
VKVRQRLIRIGPLQLGIVHALFYGILSLVFFVPFVALMFVFGPRPPNQQAPPLFVGAGLVMLLLMPFFYAAFGFVFGVIAAALYNLIARITGGIDFTVEDAPPSTARESVNPAVDPY